MRALFTAAIAICVLTLPSASQNGTASLAGKVKDITGAGVPGTVAELESERPPFNRFQTVADAAGMYRLPGLPAGEYDLKLSQPGFRWSTIKSIHILGGEQKSVPDVRLAIGGCDTGPVLDYIRFLSSGDPVGNLGGTVRLDEGPLVGNSKPIVGAIVTLLCFAGNKACGQTTTDSDGAFLFKALPPRDFSVQVTSPGFYPLNSPDYRVDERIESIYSSIYIERCPQGNCDPKLRPPKPLVHCE